MSFRAIVVEQTRDGRAITSHRAELQSVPDAFLTAGPAATLAAAAPGEPGTAMVDIAVEYSSLNYKDAMALAGRPGIVAVSPLIPGIDLAGTVTSSTDRRIRVGDRVIMNGAGAGERMHGGFAERARVPAGALVRLDDALTTRQAAAIGTAGFTAMLSVLALERGGVTSEASGDLPVLVTGATGGVGSVATALLSHLGYRVVAATGRVDEYAEYLRRLGADEILDRAELETTGRPLQRQRWAGAVDVVGGTILANVLAQTRYGGTVTACGLAQSPDLTTTVLPFILRGVHLAGINSVDAPRALREEAWRRLTRDLDRDLLDEMTNEVPLEEVIALAEPLLTGKLHGRTVVRTR